MTDLIDQYKRLHAEGKFTGHSLKPHISTIGNLIAEHKSKWVLDYGCGKAELYYELRLQERWGCAVWFYDPAVPEFATKPNGKFDGVVCTDVMEHLPEEQISPVLEEIFDLARSWALLSICTRKARKTLPDGRNAHLTVKPRDWWAAKIAEAKLQLGRPLEVQVVYTK